jgi:hypothetical protein
MGVSSIRFEPVSSLTAATAHNNREIIPDYVIGDASKNECTGGTTEVLALYMSKSEEAHKNYFKRTGQKIQTKSEKFVWEALLNIEEHHTLEDIMILAKEFEKKYSWQILQISLHKDEGHRSETTMEKKMNFHAHILFFMLSPTGIYCFKQRDFGKKKMAEIQTFVANKLKMERGRSKLKTNAEHLNHRQFRQVARKISDIEIDLIVARNEADNFEGLMLHEYELRLSYEDEILKLKQKMEALKNENMTLKMEKENKESLQNSLDEKYRINNNQIIKSTL